MTQPHECTKIAEAMPVSSSGHLHDCTKKSCAYCYEMNRTHVDWYMPIWLNSRSMGKHKKFGSIMWSGCEKMLVLALQGRPQYYPVRRFLPNRTKSAIHTKAWELKKQFGILPKKYLIK